jgi:nucleoside-diphosphate-sugar epimerase
MLGGTHHVGQAVVETALARGDDVTTLNRGMTGRPRTGNKWCWPACPAGRLPYRRPRDRGVFTLSAAILSITRPCGPIGLR